MRTPRIAALLACLAAAAGCYDEGEPPAGDPGVEQSITSRRALRDDVRQLWAQRAFWTRNYLVDVLAELPSQDTTLRRLMQTQVALGEAMKPFYGDAAGTELSGLLEQNVTLGNRLMLATREGGHAGVEQLTSEWQLSTSRLADFFAAQHPALSREELQQQLRAYDGATAQQMKERLATNWEADLAAADASMGHALTIADTLAAALTAQFSSKISKGQALSSSEEELHVALRTLWVEHANWQRLHLVSDVSRLLDVTATANRLMANQVALGNALVPYYGDAAGTQLADLLTGHIVIAGEVLNAARTGEQGELEAAKTKWHANAEAIAAFLASVSPYLVEGDLKPLLHAHLEQLMTELTARLSGDYEGELAAHAIVEHHVLVLADAISGAISNQFEGNFKSDG